MQVEPIIQFVDPGVKDYLDVYYEVRTERTKFLTAQGPEYVKTLKSKNLCDAEVTKY